MTEWVLPADHQAEYQRTVKETAHEPAAQRLRPFVRAGGFWRNFKARYAESDEMYSRMLGLSRRLAETEDESESETDNGGQVDPDYLEAARQELYRAQCNCPYWHGAFGGLYLPHLRNAVYRGLIAAHNALDEAEGKPARASRSRWATSISTPARKCGSRTTAWSPWFAPPRAATCTSSTTAAP
jgi:alpha-amylase